MREFDELKRSCRERLAHHNMRRRTVTEDLDSTKGGKEASGQGKQIHLSFVS